jgi:hypothetical protein
LISLAGKAIAGGRGSGATDFSRYEWAAINDNAEWTPRAGLQVVTHRNAFHLMAGRAPRPLEDANGEVMNADWPRGHL